MINRNFTAANFFLEYQQSCQLNLLGPFLQFDVVNWQMGCKPAFFNVFLGQNLFIRKQWLLGMLTRAINVAG
jgi:hypothetical protein